MSTKARARGTSTTDGEGTISECSAVGLLRHPHFLKLMTQLAREAVEKALLDSLLKATTVSGHEGRTAEAIPLDELRPLLRQR